MPELDNEVLIGTEEYKHINLILKPIDKHFSFEFILLDTKNKKRVMRFTTHSNLSRVKPHECIIPLKLEEGWNKIGFNYEELCKKTYGTSIKQFLSITVYANCRIRCIFLSQTEFKENDFKNALDWDFKKFKSEKREN